MFSASLSAENSASTGVFNAFICMTVWFFDRNLHKNIMIATLLCINILAEGFSINQITQPIRDLHETALACDEWQ